MPAKTAAAMLGPPAASYSAAASWASCAAARCSDLLAAASRVSAAW